MRELINAMEYLVAAQSGDVVAAADVLSYWESRAGGPPARPPPPPLAPLDPAAAAVAAAVAPAPPPAAAPSPTPARPARASFRPIKEEVRELERRRMSEALDETGGNRTRAAALIRMPLRTFLKKLRLYGLGDDTAR